MKELKVNEGTSPSAIPSTESQSGERFTVQDLNLIRRILLSVIDDFEYHFYEGRDNARFISEEAANANRLDFCDEVSRRIVEVAKVK